MPFIIVEKSHFEKLKVFKIVFLLIVSIGLLILVFFSDIPSQMCTDTDKYLFSPIRVDYTVCLRNIEAVVIKFKSFDANDRCVLDKNQIGTIMLFTFVNMQFFPEKVTSFKGVIILIGYVTRFKLTGVHVADT
ncbi:uncharacterized protein EV154DRAFT_477541 [Mucor mucedo]|uniref:uncharacterized protein n=1 Tax=Mucor mucedo TaxID=29922 RepID=UPI00222050DA|nr:uncharacterized protein EV154DRAFT_477541 [Mucor mucedo]KAI7895416.1 hypothetical protein EV154DRAFT_477541 [Mucor mucedo]